MPTKCSDEEIDAFIANYPLALLQMLLRPLSAPHPGILRADHAQVVAMEEGTISSWLVDEGDEIEVGDEIVEIETDKIAQPVESTVAGVLRLPDRRRGRGMPVRTLRSPASSPTPMCPMRPSMPTWPNGRVGQLRPLKKRVAETAPAAATSKRARRCCHRRTVTNSWTIPQFPVTMGIDARCGQGLPGWSQGSRQSGLHERHGGQGLCHGHGEVSDSQRHPGQQEYKLNPEVNIAVAVGLDDGLMMPVVKGCQATQPGRGLQQLQGPDQRSRPAPAIRPRWPAATSPSPTWACSGSISSSPWFPRE
ncbi:MAG: biotin/lipoyl-containing protein [Syntrophotaleaceae bacterium]